MAKPKCRYHFGLWQCIVGQTWYYADSLAMLVTFMCKSDRQQNIQNWETIQRKAVEWYRPGAK